MKLKREINIRVSYIAIGLILLSAIWPQLIPAAIFASLLTLHKFY